MALQGDAEAMNNLGLCYQNGRGLVWPWPRLGLTLLLAVHAQPRVAGVTANATRAVECYRRSAHAGSIDAAFNLALCLKEGKGTAQDLEVGPCHNCIIRIGLASFTPAPRQPRGAPTVLSGTR